MRIGCREADVQIGPRRISYDTEGGDRGVIEITIFVEPWRAVTLNDGSTSFGHSGFALVRSDAFADVRIPVERQDDCQVVFRAMWLANNLLLGLVDRGELTLTALQHGDIRDGFDVFQK